MKGERLSSTVRRPGAFAASTEARPPLPPGPFLVVGLGRAGHSASRALAAHRGPDAVRVWDSAADADQRSLAEELRAGGVDVRLGGDGLDALDGIATVVKSPGVPPEAPVIAAATGRGLPVVDELEVGWRLVPAPIVGVTGTKGKSTTSALCTAVLTAHGLEPVLCGNTVYGPALAELAVGPPPRSLVAEISSYQLESCTDLMVDAAIFTNLSNDHLNRHLTMSAYAEAKRRLFVEGDRAVGVAALNVDDEVGASLADEIEARGGRALRYGRDPSAEYRIVDCSWDLRRSQLRLATPSGPEEIGVSLPGFHNAANVTAVLALADGLDLPREATVAALEGAAAVPGRFEAIDLDAPFDVVVDIGISPAGTAAALDTVGRVAAARGGRVIAVLCILGRSAVSSGPEAGAAARERSDHLILSGASYRGEARVPALAALWAGARSTGGAELEVVIDRRAAIARAVELARPGDVVALLGRGDTVREMTDLRGGFVALSDAAAVRELVGESAS